MLLSINNHDYSNYLLDEYNINEHKDYSTWNDTAGNLHKDLKRRDIEGTITLFLTPELFIQFQQDLEAVHNDKLYTIQVYVNNLRAVKEIQAYIEYFPTLRKDTKDGKVYADISISVEEM